MSHDPVHDLNSRDDLTERITFRVTAADRALINDAAGVFRLETTRFIRRLLLKAIRDLKPEIEKRRAQTPGLPF